MRRLLAILLALSAPGWAVLAASPATAIPPARVLGLGGSGVGMYPAFDPSVLRYAATTSGTDGGALQVTATTTDPEGTVLVDGRPTTASTTTVSGLTEGDEVSVIIDDTAGRTAYSVIYLPADFPALTVTTHAAGLAPGYVGLGLTTFGAGPSFETLIDRNGVPIWIHRGTGNDLKRQPNGDLTLFRPTTAAGHTGSDLVTLDEQFDEVARQHVTGALTDTDNHDAERLPDGSTILVGYEPRGPVTTGYLDATIQKVDAEGQVVFAWSSDGLEAETLNPLLWPMGSADQRIDYAHINSVEEIQDGTHDLIVSFRHFSAVYRIATVARDGVAAGDVVWRLGGRHSDFTFADDPDHGPCAQHTAMMLPNGNVQIFDNGSTALGPSAAGCVDHLDPLGAGIARPHTRITEYALDTGTHTATLVWSYAPVVSDPDPRQPFAFFAGSARRLANGNTLIGWADERAMLATEVAPDKTLLWEVRTPETAAHGTRFTSYRASLVDYTDAIDPGVEVTSPAANASYAMGEAATADFGCTDGGGSNLAGCSGSRDIGQSIDTSTPGTHTFTVTATDGAGNITTFDRPYVVRPPTRRVDAAAWPDPRMAWKGVGIIGSSTGQTVRRSTHPDARRTFGNVKARNAGTHPDAIRVSGSSGGRWFEVRYLAGGVDVTRRVVAGSYRSATLAPGSAASVDLRVVIVQRRGAPFGARHTVVVRATSVASASAVDRVAFVVTARR